MLLSSEGEAQTSMKVPIAIFPAGNDNYTLTNVVEAFWTGEEFGSKAHKELGMQVMRTTGGITCRRMQRVARACSVRRRWLSSRTLENA